MRVPAPIAIASCLIGTGAMWYFSTRNADFTTPPSEEAKTEVAQNWKQSHTSPPEATPISTDLKNKQATAPSIAPIFVKPTEQPKPKALPLGDLHQSPRLSEYGEHREHGTEAIIQLATQLEAKNAKYRARLAWERVIDTTQANEEQLIKSSQAIQRLDSELSPWNPDPLSDITLTLHAGATIKDKQTLKDALDHTASVISEASGYILKIKTKTSIGKGKALDMPRVPIAIWFTRPSKTSGTKSKETPPLSFMADPSQENMLTSQCQAAVYALISNQLEESTNYSELPEYPAGVKPDDLLKYYVTRLMWREFANSLK